MCVGLTTMITAVSAPASAWGFSNSQIVVKAQSYAIGSAGGQCKVWAGKVVNAVLAANGMSQRVGGYGSSGGAYYGAYQNAGGTLISAGSAQPGDLVQIIEAAQKNKDYPTGALHTAILVGTTSTPGTFVVRDSNWGLTEKVSEHTLNPVTYAAGKGASAYFWRFGVAAGSNSDSTVYFVKSHNPGSGHVEIHSATAASGYKDGQHSVTWFSPGDADNGWFQMAGSTLWFIKTKHTGSGRVEVHSATAASGYQSGGHYVTGFNTADADNGWFQMADVNRDGIQDLVFIKTKNPGSGRVEFFVADGARSYGTVTSANVTAFGPGDASNGWFQAQGPDLVFIKTRNTGSGRVEYFRASAASGYKTVVTATATAFSPGDASNGYFSSEDVTGDGVADLVFIKTHNPGSGHVEFFTADGGRGYGTVTNAVVTWLSPADANNGPFQAAGKQ